MPHSVTTVFQPSPLREPIRRRTLILIRWLAVAGQSAAVIVALLIGLQFDWQAVVAVIAAAALFNLWFSTPCRVSRLGDMRASWQLGFDLVQVTALLALTGGLSNPFALLALAPVMVAATAMAGRATITLGALTVVLISLMGWHAAPLVTASGEVLALPPLLVLGHWLALVIGVAFFAIYAGRVARELAATAAALAATQMALAREQKLQHLGGVVAAAAHEMGTPLATMKLVATELGDEIADALPDREDLADDVSILRDSVERCRTILRQMGRAGKDDLVLRQAPILTVLEEAAGPHGDRAAITIAPDLDVIGPEPLITRDPGLVHGLRNLIQNAVDFAQEKVSVTVFWDQESISIVIRDDGPGYPPNLLGRLGEPFLSTRGEDGRGHYEGMGLGLFIARTLLERTGARLRFENDNPGARVVIRWPRRIIERVDSGALGPNLSIIG